MLIRSICEVDWNMSTYCLFRDKDTNQVGCLILNNGKRSDVRIAPNMNELLRLHLPSEVGVLVTKSLAKTQIESLQRSES